ncbi:MAG: hypothetical protein GTO41_08750 [Burkholderiales bacterium]|nr:hypothetical protein [Burkholderiales bacterium]
MQNKLCTAMRGIHLVDRAGHWVQQEQPQQVTSLLLHFLQQNIKVKGPSASVAQA